VQQLRLERDADPADGVKESGFERRPAGVGRRLPREHYFPIDGDTSGGDDPPYRLLLVDPNPAALDQHHALCHDSASND
jgi:hypothetical protein